MLEAVRLVLEKITVNSFEMYMKLETGLLSIIFDHQKAGMSKYHSIYLTCKIII